MTHHSLDPRLVEMLRLEAGIIADTLGEGAVRATLRRCASDKQLRETQYIDYLVQNPVERGLFFDEILIPETWFYRDIEPFEFLSSLAEGGRWKAPIRALSMPCASGEEAYSIVIALLRGAVPTADIDVEGWDLSQRCVDRARTATYTDFSLRSTPAWLSEQYVRPLPERGRFTVREDIVSRARFFQKNALSCVQLAAQGVRFEIILCRNLFIYLERDVRDKILAALSTMLAPSGVLMLGHADGWPAPNTGLRSLGPASAFCYERASVNDRENVTISSVPSKLDSRPRAPSLVRKSTEKRSSPPVRSTTSRPLPVRANSTNDSATRSVPQTSASSQIEPLLEQARALGDRGELDNALSICESVVASSPMSHLAHRLMGEIYLAKSDLDRADSSLRKAIYLQPRDLVSLGLLTTVAERLGNRTEAENFRRRLSLVMKDNESAR